MSDTTDHSALSGDDLLAAEVALGVLAETERADAAARIARDRVFARLVAQWEERLAPWAGEVAPVAPPTAVWDRIATVLPAETPTRAGIWDNIAFWRNLALASALAAACLAIVAYLGISGQPTPLLATIEGRGTRAFVATIDARRRTVTVIPAAYAADATRVPELWLIPADGKPRSMGLLPANRPVTLTVPAKLAKFTRRDAMLAVSLEPPGGSPTGQPTGPVIASGKLTSL